MSNESIPFRRENLPDRLLAEADRALRVLGGVARAQRGNPAGRPEAHESLSPSDQRHAAALMRVNHVGEVCAQALYRGQSLFCRDAEVRGVLARAASEEVDHLAWCRDRLGELHSRPSYLNPLWYAGAFALGTLAGRAGVGRNLGFMAETEAQVEHHLDSHLVRLPADDKRSRRIVEQMRDDEAGHGDTARRHGAGPLPAPVRLSMKCMAKIMTTTAYWL
ncbi:MAG TPA: 2-polyprenyl-3-methyl-6-methoxy-1,4-benzoquinone monooxygenase [Burkholderiaceae bacterium]|nr:2-polyprenyl-3-methyl-6-methoxy-1,4-benzoquinone monooxygenase [Burkholderiaceae bacterium]